MADFNVETLQKEVEAAGMRLHTHVVEQVVAAIDAGKHVVLTGPPGTGKTTLAYLSAEVAQRAVMCTGFLPTTATTEWTTFETIGGLQPTLEGLIFRPGMFVEAIESGKWLVVDELNRANFDRAFGQLFTVLSGQAVVLPFKRRGTTRPISIVPPGVDVPPGSEPIRVPATWRIVATMNVFDKNLLFEMSFALMRRFAFIEVVPPEEEAYRELISGPGEVVGKLLDLRELKELGPAVFIDAARYAARPRRFHAVGVPPALRGLLRLPPAAVRGHRRRAGRATLRTGRRAPRRAGAHRGPPHRRAGSRGRAPA